MASSKDKLELKNFLIQFSNCIDTCGTLSNANKLTYLHSYLSGYELKIISHLSVTDDNYDGAFSLLKEEFLDIPYIVDESFKTLLSCSPSFDTAFDGLRTYVNECRAIIHDLKQYNKGNSHGLTKQFPKPETPSKASPTHISSPSTLENFSVSMSNVESKLTPKGSLNSKNPGKHCKLCAGLHSISQCDNYKSH